MGPIHFDRVEPGELITASFVNRILGQLERMQAEIDEIKGTDKNIPVITGRSPLGDITVPSELTLIGRNFLIPVNQNTVTIDGTVSITGFLVGSNDTRLIFAVPQNIAGLPKDVEVKVTNRYGSDSTTVRLVPDQTPVGQMLITDNTADLGEAVQTGHTYLFTFQLDSQTNIAETYTVTPRFTNAQGSSVSAWQTGAVLVGSSPVTIRPGAPTTVGVRVTVPAGASSVDFAIGVAAQHSTDPRLNRTSAVRTLAVGQPQKPSDSRTTLTLADIGPLVDNVRKASIDGNEGIEIRYNTRGQIPVRVQFSVTGTYRYEAEIENPGGLWQLGSPQPSVSEGTADQFTRVTTELTSMVTAPSSEQRFMVVRAIRRKDGIDDFQSYTRFPIRGFSS
ncbi:hypothetical protein ACFVZN_04055 [Streptomyces virginiae]|uniref:hypothetical protein n=1 Tax=Streptomyces virginiae TaxID=1961 RepID=UPI0036B33EA0